MVINHINFYFLKNLLCVVQGISVTTFAFLRKKGGNERTLNSKGLFYETLEECELMDPGFTWAVYSLNNRREATKIQERLDRVVV